MQHIINRTGILTMLVIVTLLTACQKKRNVKNLYVTNSLNIDRYAETISLSVDKISDFIGEFGIERTGINDGEKFLVTQAIDYNADGIMDAILFQSDLKANEVKKFTIEPIEGVFDVTDAKTTYSRFVPERIDDYAWENDRVAFRTYGPRAQALADSGKAGGTLTSGMDCWLKRVDYPVIDKWYKNDLEKVASYHVDHGEGYDPYHVGSSRGCGGLGVWGNDSLFVSKNFILYKTLATGPIRTVFELTYAPWNANGKNVREKKVISLDLGSNLTRYEVHIDSKPALADITIGITLHNKEGDVRIDSARGYIRYWEPMDDSFLGTGVVLNPSMIISAQTYESERKDQSHVFMTGRVAENKIVYYAGFGWNKSGQFSSVDDWDEYLSEFSKRLSSPLEVKVE